jgi:hypothetical protein
LRGGIARLKLAQRLAGAAARVKDCSGRQLDDAEPLRHPRGDFALQDRDRVVRPRSTLERTAYQAPIQRGGMLLSCHRKTGGARHEAFEEGR